MKLLFWLGSLFSRSSRRIRSSRRACRQKTALRRDLERHGNQPFSAWVEVLETRVLLTNHLIDFGDAPTGYPTTSAEDGARHDHATTAIPKLGDAIDYESDGAHDANADVDLKDDGVTFRTIQVGALGARVVVNVQGGDGKLDAWIDFNGDGSWGGAGRASSFCVAGRRR
jgi:hypothetical protein